MGELSEQFEQFINILKEFKEICDWRIIVSIAVGIVVFIVQIRWMNRRGELKDPKVEKAKALGHVVQAKREKYWNDDTPGDWNMSKYHATYSYEVNGKKYEYRYLEHEVPPTFINLYYINNPRKVVGDYKKKEYPGIFYFLPIIVTVALVVFLNKI